MKLQRQWHTTLNCVSIYRDLHECDIHIEQIGPQHFHSNGTLLYIMFQFTEIYMNVIYTYTVEQIGPQHFHTLLYKCWNYCISDEILDQECILAMVQVKV